MAVALLALAVALGGTSYAVTALPARSVGPEQIKPRAVTTGKLRDGAVSSRKLRRSAVTPAKLRRGAVTREKLRAGAVTSATVRDGSLLMRDFAREASRTVGEPIQLAPGETQSGVYAVSAGSAAEGTPVLEAVSFPDALPDIVLAKDVRFLAEGEPRTAECPGGNDPPARGILCVYEVQGSNRGGVAIRNPRLYPIHTSITLGASEHGFMLWWYVPAAGPSWSYGAWAVTAP